MGDGVLQYNWRQTLRAMAPLVMLSLSVWTLCGGDACAKRVALVNPRTRLAAAIGSVGGAVAEITSQGRSGQVNPNRVINAAIGGAAGAATGEHAGGLGDVRSTNGGAVAGSVGAIVTAVLNNMVEDKPLTQDVPEAATVGGLLGAAVGDTATNSAQMAGAKPALTGVAGEAAI